MTALARLWPLFGLRLRTPRLELRVPTDDELCALAEVAAAGVHPPDTMPFDVPWTAAPSPLLERGVLQYYWRCRGEWSAERWTLDFAVFLDGRPVGAQGLSATAFPVVRSFETGSWLGRRFQGQGIGREMRAAALHFGFDGLGAVAAHSGAWEDNPASLCRGRWATAPTASASSPAWAGLAASSCCGWTARTGPRRPTSLWRGWSPVLSCSGWALRRGTSSPSFSRRGCVDLLPSKGGRSTRRSGMSGACVDLHPARGGRPTHQGAEAGAGVDLLLSRGGKSTRGRRRLAGGALLAFEQR